MWQVIVDKKMYRIYKSVNKFKKYDNDNDKNSK